jgi:hypothetical protein
MYYEQIAIDIDTILIKGWKREEKIQELFKSCRYYNGGGL